MNKFVLMLVGLFVFFIFVAQAVSNNTIAVAQDNDRVAKATFAGGCFWCMEKPF